MLEAGKLFQFVGAGRGIMESIREYFVWSTNPEVDPDDHCAPGFLLRNTAVVKLPIWLPEERTLINRGM